MLPVPALARQTARGYRPPMSHPQHVPGLSVDAAMDAVRRP